MVDSCYVKWLELWCCELNQTKDSHKTHYVLCYWTDGWVLEQWKYGFCFHLGIKCSYRDYILDSWTFRTLKMCLINLCLSTRFGEMQDRLATYSYCELCYVKYTWRRIRRKMCWRQKNQQKLLLNKLNLLCTIKEWETFQFLPQSNIVIH